MKQIRPYFLFFTLAIFLTIACKKNNETTPATAPTLTIASPVETDQPSNGQTLKIKGQVGDAAGLHTLTIKITDDKTGAVLFQSTPSVLDAKTYILDTSWTIKVSDWTDATMTITAANHAGLKTEKVVKFKVWL